MKTKLLLSVSALITACTLSSCGVAAYPGGYAYGASYNTRTVGYGNTFYSQPLLLSGFGGGRTSCQQPSYNSVRSPGGSHSHGHSSVISRVGSYPSTQRSSSYGYSSPSHSSRPNFVSASSMRASAGPSSGGGSARGSSSHANSFGGGRSHASSGGSPHRASSGSFEGGAHRGGHR